MGVACCSYHKYTWVSCSIDGTARSSSEDSGKMMALVVRNHSARVADTLDFFPSTTHQVVAHTSRAQLLEWTAPYEHGTYAYY